MAFDLWMRQPKMYMDLALEAGARKFTWHVSMSLAERREALGWTRNAAMGYGEISVMLIDDAGAAEYKIFDNYDSPRAVYPTWCYEDGIEALIALMDKNVAEDPKITSALVPTAMRPVVGQKHRVVVTDLGDAKERNSVAIRLRDLQLNRPHCELFISTHLEYNSLFGMGFQAGDAMPGNVTKTSKLPKIMLPSGKALQHGLEFDLRYKDWFSILGWSQLDIVDNEAYTRFNIDSLMWAAKNWDLATPFVQRRVKSKGERTVFMSPEFKETPDVNFVLPTARRTMMRNLGLKEELDKFTCDTCMLHNACTLARRGSVCGVKGTEMADLAKHFGTRNAQAIIDGIDQLVKKQVERVEDRIAKEEATGELDPEVSKEINHVISNATKLAKLIDPALAGGPKVQVNVGVSGGGNAYTQIAAADPKQMVAGIVRELEASGIKREDITSEMIKGVLTGMANKGQQAVRATAIASQPAVIEGDLS